MGTLNRKEISEALIHAMEKEDLNTRAVAKFLNLNPCYISMAQNPKSWDSMSKPAWIRLEEWYETREPLTAFCVPEGEEIWQPKEKVYIPKVQIRMDAKPLINELKKTREKLPKKAVYSEVYVATLESELSERDQVIKKQEKEIAELVCLTKIEKTGKNYTHPFEVKEIHPDPEQQFTDTARLKVALDIEINLVINGQKVQVN